MKLNQKTADALALPPGKTSVTYWDDDVAGLGLRCQARKRTWVVRYRPAGDPRQRQITIAPAAAMPIKQARTVAGDYLAAARQGRDLSAERKQAAETGRRARQIEQASRIGVLIELYLPDAERRFRPNSFDAEQRYLRKHWVPIHDQLAGDLTTRQIMAALEDMQAERGAIAANRAQQALRRVFVWAMHRGHIDSNPMLGQKPIADERSRNRVLSDDELAAIWNASKALGEYGTIIRLLIITGARRVEIGGMTWQEISLDDRLWTLPAERAKNGHDLKLPLPDRAIAELEAVERQPGRAHLFGKRADRGFSNWGRFKKKLDKESGVAGWVVHDLRRTLVTRMNDQGTAPHIVEAIVNHQGGHKGGVSGVYNKADRLDEKRTTLARWADHVMRISGENVASNVVPLTGTR